MLFPELLSTHAELEQGATRVNPSPRIKVLLIIGNHLLSKSVAHVIRRRPDIDIEQPAGSPNVLLAITRSQGDVMLLDSVTVEGLNRQGVTRIQDLNPNAQVLLIGMRADERDFLRAVRAGVRGYLLHAVSAAELVPAIRAVARGEAVCPSQFYRVLFDALAGIRELTRGVQKMALQLTPRQQELLGMIACGLTYKEIASRLNLSEQTVKNHMHRMLRRIGASDRSELLEIVRSQDLPN